MKKSGAQPGNQNHRKYDPEDYAEEFRLLTSLGVRGIDIIRRCDPSENWFTLEVLPLVEWAICKGCNSPFRTRKAHSLVKCSHMCGAEFHTTRNRRLRSV